MQAVRGEIAAWPADEKMVPIDRAALATKGPRRRPRVAAAPPRPRRDAARISLAAGRCSSTGRCVQDKAFHGRASDVFRFRRVLYLHPADRHGYVARYDRRRFFAELGGFLAAWGAVLRRLPSLRRQYAEGAATMTTLQFWRAVYAADASASPGSAPGVRTTTEPPRQDPAPGESGAALENR